MSGSAAPPKGSHLTDLVEVMDRLLADDGCPWDREQTLDTLRAYLLEETHEVLEALDSGVAADHLEELGDLLFQIVFQAAIREREGRFTIDDVADGIADKLRRRHPHVFGDATATTSAEVLAQWTAIKAAEKRAKGKGDRRPSALDGLPKGLPALAFAQGLSDRAARVGFDWPDVQGSFDKIKEEVGELQVELACLEAGDEAGRAPAADPALRSRLEWELGDLLFAGVNLARKLGLDAESSLRAASSRFQNRFHHIERELENRGKTPAESDLAEMDQLWNEAKGSKS